MANEQNLKPFLPGYDERRHLKGPPVGTVSLPAMINKILDGTTVLDVDSDEGEVVRLTRRQKIWLKIIMDAEDDEDPNIRMKAAMMIFDRTEGKPAAPIEISGTSGGPIQFNPNASLEDKLRALEALEAITKENEP